MADPACWALTTGEAGAVNQALGLAEAVGLPFVEKRITLRRPWRWLPGHLCPFALHGLGRDGDDLAPPWPELLISCGRRTVAAALAIRRRGALAVYVQDPHVPPSRFDMVVPPRHDRVRGANVYPTRAALHRVTAARLEEAGARFRDRFAGLPRPLVAVLVGGDSGAYRFPEDAARSLADRLAALAATGAGLVVTTSRRTGPRAGAVLRTRLGVIGADIWDGSGDNPYLGMLALADHIVVTEDSVSMVSEACATGKPVHVFPLSGGSARMRRFHDSLRAEGVTRPFCGRLESWSYPPIREAESIAGIVRAKLRARMTDAAAG
jgi:mitochondrial fission protein ELM1